MKTEWETLLTQWRKGTKNREVALNLLFLSWYSCSEPPYLSGLEGVEIPKLFVDELFRFLGGEEAQDLEVLYVVKVMVNVAPYCLGDEQYWERVGNIFSERLGDVVPNPKIFEGRGSYGEYFAHQARFWRLYPASEV